VGVDGNGEIYVYDIEPYLTVDFYLSNNEHDIFIARVEATEPQLFKFNPFYDEETN
jgi:hypothetical protein